MSRLSVGRARANIETRRCAARRHVVLSCQVVRERDFVLLADRTIDVSTFGMLLPALRPATLGEAVIVSFLLPGMWVDAEARITRTIHGRRPGDDGPALGISFDSLGASARAAIAGYLHGRPPPLPRRGPIARLRRGESAPALADEVLMRRPVLPALSSAIVADEADVETVPEAPSGIDGLRVLREMAAAWRGLALTQ